MGTLTPGNGVTLPGGSTPDTGGSSGTTIKDAASAMAWAQQEESSPTQDWYEKCQTFVREALGFTSGTASTAIDAWNKTPSGDQHPGDRNPPQGVPVYWSGGSAGDGHVALSAGGGYVYSTDIGGRGTVSLVPLMAIEQQWGLTYKGWADQEAGTGKLYGGSSGGGGHGWTYYLNPLNDIKAGTSAASDAVTGAVKDAVSNILDPVLNFFKQGAIRAAYFLGGGILLIFFLWKAGGTK